MSYFKIGSTDFSSFVNELKVSKVNNYNSQTNAAGNTVVDFINSKRVIEVGFIPLDDTDMKSVLSAIDGFNVSISFLNPLTNTIVSNVNCIIDSSEIEYYTIQVGNVMYKAFTLTFTEL